MILSTNAIIETFVESLKIRSLFTYEVKDSKVSHEMITGFNLAHLHNTILPSSAQFKKEIAQFDILSSSIFQPGEKWINRGLIREVADDIAKIQGWEVRYMTKEMLFVTVRERRQRNQ